METHWNHLQDTLQHLFIGENDLVSFPEHFSKLRTLSTLNLDNNLITSIPSNIRTPSTLETLSISNNFLQEFPLSLLETGTALNRLYIRDNYIENMTKKDQFNFEFLRGVGGSNYVLLYLKKNILGTTEYLRTNW